jgi:hypothetical protein
LILLLFNVKKRRKREKGVNSKERAREEMKKAKSNWKNIKIILFVIDDDKRSTTIDLITSFSFI